MAHDNSGEEVPCVYVYEEEKNIAPDDANFTTPIYQNDDIALEDGGSNDPSIRTKSAHQDHGKKSKKRLSRYDEDHYALPDDDDDHQPDSPESESRKENNSTAKSTVSSLWRTACCLSSGLMLISITANILLLYAKDQDGNSMVL